MINVLNFICWTLTHVKPETVPQKAILPLALKECGTEPWEYLYGSVCVETSQSTLDRYFETHYSKKMSRAEYDKITASWSRTGHATDCQGLCDAYLTYECNEKTDINAHMNYTEWCTEKGKISDIDRSFVVGEAVFMQSKSTVKMTHVGWICGFDADGDPLVVEARGLKYGVVVTRFESRSWTHRGLMMKKFNYESEDTDMDMPMVLEKTSPMMQGEGIKQLQKALNALGYRDEQGLKLDEDGKCGAKTMQATQAFANAHAVQPIETAPVFCITSDDGKCNLKVHITEIK